MTPGSHPEDDSFPIHHGQQTDFQEALRPEHGQTHAGGYPTTSRATASTQAPGLQSPAGYSDSSNHQVYPSAPIVATAEPTSISQFQSRNAASSVSHARPRPYPGFASQVNNSFQINEPCFNCGVYGHWAQFCPQPRRDIPFGSTQAWNTNSITVPSSRTGTFQHPSSVNLHTNANINSPQVESDEARQFREREERLAELGVSGCPKPVLPLHRAGYNTSISPLAPLANSSLKRRYESWPSSQMQHNQAGQSDFQQLGLKSCDDMSDNYPKPQFSGVMSISPHTQQRFPPFTPVPLITQQGHPSHSGQGLNRRQRRSSQYHINSPTNNIGSNDTQSVPHQIDPGSVRNAGWRRRNRPIRLSDAVIVASDQNPMVGWQVDQSAAPSTTAIGAVTKTDMNHNRKRSHSDQDQDSPLDNVTRDNHEHDKRPRYGNDA